jgi:hypothetical protein
MAEPDFLAGELSIRYLEEHPELVDGAADDEEVVAAAIVAALVEDDHRAHGAPRVGGDRGGAMSAWRSSGWPWRAR